MDTVVRRQEKSSRWVGEVTLDTVVIMEVNSSWWMGEVTADTGHLDSVVSMEVNSNTPGKVGEGGDLGHCGQNSEGSLGRVEGTPAGYHLFWVVGWL